ncbi:hypothetical protein WS85_12850 [Burkholderia anthina]|uniref:hypothetical protein n=1 Tax=Burkholderia anthina TaxID=179879 RepID=UPI000759CF83|nr:hypothetical protein [Burkholderia anthina]KVH12220.1 hypothetical protein WS85_12850 [Burkholderia anthina]KVX39312.1 hypothetical protein WT32_06825 [Burkholderia anthina]
MGNYNSYSTYVPSEDTTAIPDTGPTTRVAGGTSSVVFRDGQAIATESKHASASVGDLSAYGEGDWRATARSGTGFPTNRIEADTVVSINGMNASVGAFVKAGILRETDGGYVLPGEEARAVTPSGTSGNDDEAAVETARDAAVMAEEVAQGVDAATDPFDQSTLDAGLAHAIAAATGDMSVEDVVQGVAQRSGMEPAEVGQRVQFVIDAYQAQADGYLTSNGLSAEQVPQFYEWAKKGSNKAALTTAIQQQAYARSMAGWKPLIAAFKRTSA